MELAVAALHDPLWREVERGRVLDIVEPRGHLEVFLPSPSTQVTRASGHLSYAMALRWIEVLEPVFDAHAPLSNHHHWLHVASYDSNARRAVTSWAIRRASSCASIQFLCKSRLVTMAIATVNLATARTGLIMLATTSEAEFKARLTAVLGGHQQSLPAD
jgi:hypothetical protein